MAPRAPARAPSAAARATAALHLAAAALTATGLECKAETEDECLVKAGCRWFALSPDGECDLCESWFGNQAAVTGCRDWTLTYFCHDMLFGRAQSKWNMGPSDPAFVDALQRYRATQGSGEKGHPHLYMKRIKCSVWCDATSPYPCFGQPRAIDEFKGVNYGGRFIPERYLHLPGTDALFAGVDYPAKVDGREVRTPSLCDVGGAPDAIARTGDFLDRNVKMEHFEKMKLSGFNIVRLPLGYWNVIDAPGTISSASVGGGRRGRLERIMPAKSYMKWIDNVFLFAGMAGLRVLLDLHGGPGGQTSNAFTGCDDGKGAGGSGFDSEFSMQLAADAIGELARICKRHDRTCYGIELLNEPDSSIHRSHLKLYYERAIRKARVHLAWNKPLVIMEWTASLPWWQERQPFSYERHGRVVFSTHVYGPPDVSVQEDVRKAFAGDIRIIAEFSAWSRYEIVVTEYALSGHGTGDPGEDDFDYHSLANWLVHQFNQHSLGSAVWNFDASETVRPWGPVAQNKVGLRPVKWKEILSLSPLRPRLPGGGAPGSGGAGGPGEGKPGATPTVWLWVLIGLLSLTVFLSLLVCEVPELRVACSDAVEQPMLALCASGSDVTAEMSPGAETPPDAGPPVAGVELGGQDAKSAPCLAVSAKETSSGVPAKAAGPPKRRSYIW